MTEGELMVYQVSIATGLLLLVASLGLDKPQWKGAALILSGVAFVVAVLAALGVLG